MRKTLFILFLLFPSLAYGAPPARQASYETNTVISSTEVTNNEDVIYSYLQQGVDTYKDDTIVNADVNSAANIQSSKLNLTAITQDMAIVSSGSFTNAADTTLNGDVTVGDASGDALTFNPAAWTLSNAVTITGTWTDLGTVTTADINGGTFEGTIGSGTAGKGTFTSTHYEETTAPSTAASEMGCYTKDTGGQPELFCREESDGDEVQITDSGALSVDRSNVIFQVVGHVTAAEASRGFVTNASLTADSPTSEYMYLNSNAGTFEEVWATKWIKAVGVNTVTVYAQIWQRTTTTASVEVDIGGASGESDGTGSQTTPEWVNFTVDVSGLTNGTAYDLSVRLKNSGGIDSYGANIVGFAS